MIGRQAGKHSEAVKLARKLVRDRSERLARELCVLEGLRVVSDYLAAGGAVELAFASASARCSEELLCRLESSAGELLRLDDELLDSLAGTKSTQGLLVVVPRPDDSLLPAAASRPLLVGWGLQDPSNVGALTRAAAAAGCCGVLLARAPGEALANPFSPRAVRASAGAGFRLPVLERELAAGELARELGDAGYRLVALSPHEGRPPEQLDLKGAVALLVGSETRGLPEALEAASERLSFPLENGVESVGAAAAGAVALFEAARQRRLDAPRQPG